MNAAVSPRSQLFLFCLSDDQEEEDACDGAGQADTGFEGDQLHPVADAHVDGAAGCMEEGSMGQGIDNGGAGMVYGVRHHVLEGLHLKAADRLYSHNKPENEKVRLTAVPYYAWANREEGDMRVWIEEE